MDRIKLMQNPLPIDRVAARVVFGKAEHWNPLRIAGAVFDVLPPLIDLDALPVECFSSGFPDLRGLPFGRLVVIGLLDNTRADHRPSEFARWVCRCHCGTLTLREQADILQGCGPHEQCGRCDIKESMRNCPDYTTHVLTAVRNQEPPAPRHKPRPVANSNPARHALVKPEPPKETSMLEAFRQALRKTA